METEEVFCPSAEDIERWMDSAFDMVGGSDRTVRLQLGSISRHILL